MSVVGASGVQAPRTTYTILNASGGVAGTFASANSLYPFLLPQLSYDANNVYLTLQVGGFAAAAQTATQQAVGRVLDANVFTATGDFATVIGTHGRQHAVCGAGAGDADVAERPELLELLERHGAGRPALHEQLQQPDRRRRLARQQPRGAWPKPATSPATSTSPAAVGRVGRCAGRPGHDRRQHRHRGRHLQRRRLRGRPRPHGGARPRVGVTTGYTTGTQWTSGLQRQGHHRHFPGRPLRQLPRGQGLRRRRARLRLQLQPDVAADLHPRPAAAHRAGPHRGQPVLRPDRGRLSLRHRHARPRPTSRRSRACRATPARRTASPRPARSRSTSRWRGRPPTRCAR